MCSGCFEENKMKIKCNNCGYISPVCFTLREKWCCPNCQISYSFKNIHGYGIIRFFEIIIMLSILQILEEIVTRIIPNIGWLTKLFVSLIITIPLCLVVAMLCSVFILYLLKKQMKRNK